MDEGFSYKVYGQENLINNDFNIGQRYINIEKFLEMREYEIFLNDIVISMMGTIGKCKVVPNNITQGIMDSHLVRIRTNYKIIPKFLSLLIDESHYINVQLELESKGSIMSGLNSTIIKELKLILPDVDCQRKILSFLDQKTSGIDSLIADKEKLIELLQEKRQAIISEAVTKGLDKNVKMKDSGNEWIGEVPEHWEIKKVKYIINNLDYKRIPLSSEDRGLMEEKIYDYYGASGKIDLVDDYIFDDTVILIGEDGANLYSRSTPLAFLVSGKFWVNNHAHILKPKFGDIRYFVDLLEIIDYTIYISGSAQPKLTQENLGIIQIPCPPISEQFQIVDFLKNKKYNIDNLLSEIQVQIDKLKEYRQALISEAVTGKIMV